MPLLDDCVRFTAPMEGWSATPYQHKGDVPTQGYGHTKGVSMDAEAITLEQGLEWLKNDLSVALRAVERLITVPLTNNQIIALTDFTFNLGSGALQRSTLRQKINRRDFGDCPQEFAKWVWSGGRKLPGLIRRRSAESALFQSPQLLEIS